MVLVGVGEVEDGGCVFFVRVFLLGVLLYAGAQLLLKAGMRRIGYIEFGSANLVPLGLQGAANPFVVAGLLA